MIWIKSCERMPTNRKLVALGLSKAFARVCHDALSLKLIVFDVCDNFSRFISSFPRDRTILVIVGGISSDQLKAKDYRKASFFSLPCP